MQLSVFPEFVLVGGQTSECLEDTEERCLVGEAWFDVDLSDFDVRTAFEQSFGVVDAIVVDQLDEGDTLLGVDTVGDISFVGTQLVGDISHLIFKKRHLWCINDLQFVQCKSFFKICK